MSSTQEKYVHSLKQIKEAEEKAQGEIETRKKAVVEEIKKLQNDAEKAIESAKLQAEKLVETNIDQAGRKAAQETEKIIEEARTKAKNITADINSQLAQQIIDILLKGVQ